MEITISLPDEQVKKLVLDIAQALRKPEQLAIQFESEVKEATVSKAEELSAPKAKHGRGPRVTKREVEFIEAMNQADITAPSAISERLYDKLGILRNATGVQRVMQRSRVKDAEGNVHYTFAAFESATEREHAVA